MHFFGGGTPELFSRSDFRTVDRTIEEPARAEAVTQAMERMNELLASTVEKRRETFQKLNEMDVKVNSQEVSYDEMLDELWRTRREAGQKYIEEVFVMRKHMTRDEWNAAFVSADE